MAGGALGSLTVKLGLDTAEFTGGLSKADFEAKKFAENLGRTVDAGVNLAIAGLAAMVTATVGAVVAFDALIKKAGDFQDLAEETGAMAEVLASFGVAAATAGTSVESVAGSMIKLTKSLVGVDDESKAAGAALVALGINVESFKKLDPAAQYELVGKSLSNFADGAEKTAVAVSLFGKSGAEQLRVFKALEEQGGRTIILTAEQIRQADEYADKQAKVRAEFAQQAQALATRLIPVLTDVFDIVTDLAKAFSQSSAAADSFNVVTGVVLTTLQTVSIVAANVAYVFNAVGRELGGVAAQWVALQTFDFKGFTAIGDAMREDAKRARAELDAFEKRVMTVGQRTRETGLDFEFSGTSTNKPRINFAGRVGKDKKDAADKQTEAEKYLKTLQDQYQKTEGLTIVEKVLDDIQRGRLKVTDEGVKKQILDVAKLIDQEKEYALVLKEMRASATAAGDAINKANEARAATLKQLADATPSAKLQKDRADAQLLTEEFEAGRLSEAAYIEQLTARFDLNAQKLAETKSAAEELGLTFTSAFEEAIAGGKSFSDVLAGLGNDLLKLALRKSVTEPLFNAVSGSGFFSGLAGLFGGGKAAGGPVDAGRLYRVNENGPEMLDVNGSQYLMMGSKGGTVRPGSQSGGGGMNLTVNVGAGASRSEVIAAVQQGVATSVGMVSESQRRRGGIA